MKGNFSMLQIDPPDFYFAYCIYHLKYTIDEFNYIIIYIYIYIYVYVYICTHYVH